MEILARGDSVDPLPKCHLNSNVETQTERKLGHILSLGPSAGSAQFLNQKVDVVERNFASLFHSRKVESRVESPPQVPMCIGIGLHDQRAFRSRGRVELPVLLELYLGARLVSVVDVSRRLCRGKNELIGRHADHIPIFVVQLGDNVRPATAHPMPAVP